MTATMPDRLSTDPKSPHYDEALLEAGGVRERATTLIALLEFGGEAGPTTMN